MKVNALILIVIIITMPGCNTVQKREISSSTSQQSFHIYQNNEKGLKSIITNKALKSFKNKYSEASQNKAFAQSLSGSWNWRANRTTREHAVTSALVSCQKNNKKYEDTYPCEVINVNDEWVDQYVPN